MRTFFYRKLETVCKIPELIPKRHAFYQDLGLIPHGSRLPGSPQLLASLHLLSVSPRGFASLAGRFTEPLLKRSYLPPGRRSDFRTSSLFEEFTVSSSANFNRTSLSKTSKMVNFNGKYKWVKNEDFDEYLEKMGEILNK